jgi:phosphatidylinositol alpha-1,6-mannosyltransferase
VIVHGAELLTPAAVPLLRARLATSLPQADLLLPVSDFTRKKLGDFLERGGKAVPPMEVLRARVDTGRFRPTEDRSALKKRLGWPDDKVILCFGRLVPRKGVHRLIDALPEVAKRVPNVRLVVAGTGPEMDKLRRRARPQGDRILFTGRVPEDQAAQVYAAADVFALAVADRWFGLEIEGLGVVLLEAGAAGTPSVTGRSGGTPEAVVDGRSGYVVDARNRNELAARIADVLADEDRSRSMGGEARRHVERNFSGQDLPIALTEWLRSES